MHNKNGLYALTKLHVNILNGRVILEDWLKSSVGVMSKGIGDTVSNISDLSVAIVEHL